MEFPSISIPDSFFKSEVRDGYLVTEEMKNVWAVELDILAKFISVCKDNGLRYFADGGTILGAVRHKGFIPWDNDIDVAMPRPDFDRLLEIGSTQFNHPYFFQTPHTEGGKFFRTWVKICNSNTTGASVEEYKKGINCGIFIDVFPLDIVPANKFLKFFFIKKLDFIRKNSRFSDHRAVPQRFIPKIKYIFKLFIYRFLCGAPKSDELFRRYHRFAGSFWSKKASQIADLSHGYVRRFAWDIEDWRTFVSLPFEFLKINCPIGYDSVLKRQYGEYMRFPKDISTHSYISFDADIPYYEYFKDKV